MNCSAPFPDPPPFGRCHECGGLHRLDIPCGRAIDGAMRLVALVVVAVFAAACAGAWFAGGT